MVATTPSAPPLAGAAPVRGDDVSGRRGTALLAALLLACLYAAFAHGAVDEPQEARLQVGLAALALVAAAWALGRGGVRVHAPRAAWWGLALLAAFGAWCALTLAWS